MQLGSLLILGSLLVALLPLALPPLLASPSLIPVGVNLGMPSAPGAPACLLRLWLLLLGNKGRLTEVDVATKGGGRCGFSCALPLPTDRAVWGRVCVWGSACGCVCMYVLVAGDAVLGGWGGPGASGWGLLE